MSHWDTALTPNQLMEPSYTVPLDPALEIPLFHDIGWTLPTVVLTGNGDGKTDILWRHSTTGQVYVWLMNGVTLRSAGTPGAVPDTNWRIARVGDLDGDGKADLVWRHSTTGQVYVWLMNGPTRLTLGSPGTVPDLGWQIQPQAPHLGGRPGAPRLVMRLEHETRSPLAR